MRAKEVFALVPVPSHLVKYAYSRITLTRFTTAYFVVAFTHALLLSGFQLGSHLSNKNADITLSQIMKVAEVKSGLIPVITNQNGQDVLRLCNGIPSSANDERCETIVIPTDVSRSTNDNSNVSNNNDRSSSASVTQTRPSQLNAGLLQEAQGTLAPLEDISALQTGVISASIVSTATIDTAATLDSTNTTSTSAPTPTSTSVQVEVAAVTTSSSVEIPKAGNETESLSSSTQTSIATLPTIILDPITETSQTESEVTSSTVESSSSTTEESSSALVSATQESESSSATTAPTSTSDVQETTTSSSAVEASEVVSSSSSTAEVVTSSTESETSTTSTRLALPTLETTSIESTSESSRSTTSEDVRVNETGLSERTSRTLPSLPTAVLSTRSSTKTAEESTSASSTEQTSEESSTSSQTTELVSTASSETSNSTSATNTSESVAPASTEKVGTPRQLSKRVNVSPVANSTTGLIAGLNVTNLAGQDSTTYIDLRCAQSLSIVEEQLHQSGSEDLVMLGYYVWLFGLGTVAILNESIPHLSAALLSSALALVWSGVQISRTRAFHQQFNLFIKDGACDGIDLIPSYWADRAKIEVPSFVLNAICFLLLVGFGLKLLSVYQRETMKTTGEDSLMKRLYRTVLLLSVIMQTGMFLLLASLALWVQQLFDSPIASFSTGTPLFKGVGMVSVLMVLPWFIIGWIAIRREHKMLMIAFLIMTVFFLGSWTVVFSSDIYRLVFTKWSFFAVITITSFGLLVGSLLAGLLCRLRFGQGLAVQLAEKDRDEVDTTPWEFSTTVEKAWEPFGDVRQSQFTASDRQSTAFSYGLRSPAPPVPAMPAQLSRFST